jgi:hypothetical protein
MAAIVRRTAVILLVIAAGALLGACGKSAHFGSRTKVRTKQQAQATTSSGKPLSKAAAMALASALNLQHGDLPSFQVSKPEHEPETPAARARERKFASCIGGPLGGEAIADVSSKTFERHISVLHVGVSSSVQIAKTSAQAREGLQAIASERTQRCVAQLVQALVVGKTTHTGGSFRLGSVSKATPSAPGTSGTFAWRISGAYTLKGVHIPFYLDLVGFAYEQDDVQLLAYGIPVQFPAVGIQDLLTLLVERAKAGGRLAPRGHGARPKVPAESGPRQVQI